MDREKIKIIAKRRLDGRVVICFALMLLVQFSFSVMGIVPVIGIIASIVLGGPLSLSFSYIYYKLVKNNKAPDLEDLVYGLSDDNFLRGFVGYLLNTIFVFLWSLLLIVPGIIKSISYSQMFYIMVDHPGMDAQTAMDKSKKLMDGHKMDYFVLQLSFIPWYILVIVTFGLFYIWVGPYVEATNAAFYLEISKPTNRIKEAVEKVVKDVKNSVDDAKEKISRDAKAAQKKLEKNAKAVRKEVEKGAKK
ncbi:DUF975 family protein [Candidatus Saccharibacteria bacterium]|nr:DUF975 family protein [Candidatus Saccharibacteria bacterium]